MTIATAICGHLPYEQPATEETMAEIRAHHPYCCQERQRLWTKGLALASCLEGDDACPHSCGPHQGSKVYVRDFKGELLVSQRPTLVLELLAHGQIRLASIPQGLTLDIIVVNRSEDVEGEWLRVEAGKLNHHLPVTALIGKGETDDDDED